MSSVRERGPRLQLRSPACAAGPGAPSVWPVLPPSNGLAPKAVGRLGAVPQGASSSVRSGSSHRFLSLYLTDGTDRFVR